MKRLLTSLIAVLFLITGCKIDTSEIDNRLDDFESRISRLEQLCAEMNININSLQTIVDALQHNDYVTSVEPLVVKGETVGYKINFSKSDSVVIYHGEDGDDGKDGKDGKDGLDGKDGHSPVVGVAKGADGVYYWTLDGEWIIDSDGNKIKAEGRDGADGKDGKDGEDGIVPQLKIEEGFWFISYDNGKTWEKLYKAVGEDGKDGADGKDGDSFFQSVDTSNADYIVFKLADGTEIKVPTWYAFEQLQKLCNEMNTNITALQTIVAALQNNDYVQSVTPLMENGKEIGYTITFTKSPSITIYHGTSGKDGHTPLIGVKADTDNVYYWTVDGEWLLDAAGSKIRAEGKDGLDGENGIAPQLKIEEGYWHISYDNGKTWEKLYQAVGEDGKDGADGKYGDSFFQSVDTSNMDYVVFKLADGTEIKVPTWYAFEQLQKLCNEMNTNITALQTIVNALQENDYIESVDPIIDNGDIIGYKITFSKSQTITILNGKAGKDGQNGKDGKDGKDGVDGHTPLLSVYKDNDGIFYWTVDGQWLLDAAGNKIKAEGVDAITPQLKIEGGFWYISYDNGNEWTKLGKATGEDAKEIFKSVEYDNRYAYFTLSDGTLLTVPLSSGNLFDKLHDIIYMPEYSDGIVELVKIPDDFAAEFTFRISPAQIIPDLQEKWKDYVFMKAFYTENRNLKSVNLDDMPILSFKSDETTGTITVVASCKNISKDFYKGICEVNSYLVITDGNVTVTSDNIKLQLPKLLTFTVEGITFNMKLVEGGKFVMGGFPHDVDVHPMELPPHDVTLSNYYIAECETTQELWVSIMGSNPSKNDNKMTMHNPKDPVEYVSWKQIVEDFLPKLKEVTGTTFNLPTEAQWEFAARGGNESHGYLYSGADSPYHIAWYSVNSNDFSREVGVLPPNELGIHDMSGNVGELCYDWYVEYTSEDQVDPKGPSYGDSYKVVRGGSFHEDEYYCRVTYRGGINLELPNSYVGFRLAFVPWE